MKKQRLTSRKKLPSLARHTSSMLCFIFILALVLQVNCELPDCTTRTSNKTFVIRAQASSNCETYELLATVSLDGNPFKVIALGSSFAYRTNCSGVVDTVYYSNFTVENLPDFPVRQHGPLLRKRDEFSLTFTLPNWSGNEHFPAVAKISIYGVVSDDILRSRCRLGETRFILPMGLDRCIQQTKQKKSIVNFQGSFDLNKSWIRVEGFKLPPLKSSEVTTNQIKTTIRTCGSKCVSVS